MDKSTNLTRAGQAMPKSIPEGGFTQIANAVLLDDRLSFKARGILALILSRPKGWQIYLDEVAKRSEKDGKRAVQTGFKELVAKGYVVLLPIYNDETGRFEGTCYQINQDIFLAGQAYFKTVCNSDPPESGPSEIQTVSNSDHPKTASLSNTKSSNTEISNTKPQQQPTADAAIEKEKKTTSHNVDVYWDDMKRDSSWHQKYLGINFAKRKILSAEYFQLLLLHFRQNALRQDTTYTSIEAVKQHFANWFTTNHSRQRLHEFILEQRNRRKQIRAKLGEMVLQTDKILDQFQQQRCQSKEQVLSFKAKLLEYQAFYKHNLPYINEDGIESAVQLILEDICKQIRQIERGQKARKLDWYTKNALANEK